MSVQVPKLLIMIMNLIEHALTCTLEKDFEDMSRGGELRFGTINEVINVGR